MKSLIKKLPNLITLLRVVLTCFLCIYTIEHFGSMIIPVIVVFGVFISDFLDGKVARLFGTVSYSGMIFDVLADLFFIIAFYTVLWYHNILPLWFLFIILFKFIEFVVTSILLKKFFNRKITFVFDFIGRFVAALFYVIPILAYVSFQYFPPVYFFTIHLLIYIIAFLAFVSFLYRAWNCVKSFKIQAGANLFTFYLKRFAPAEKYYRTRKRFKFSRDIDL